MSAVAINFSVVDAKGKTSRIPIHVPTGFTILQYVEAANAFGQLLTDLLEGSITEISVSIPVSLSGATLKAAATSIADLAKKALFLISSSVSGLGSKINLPTYREAYTVTGSDVVDLSDPDVAAFVTILEDGVNVAGTPVLPCDLRGNDLVQVNSGREIFRRYN